MKYIKTYEAKYNELDDILIVSIIDRRNKAAIDLINDPKINVNYRDSDGYTPLLVAAIRNNDEVVKLLIDKGADINVLDHRGQTPLMIAANIPSLKLIQIFIKYGADWNIIDKDKTDFVDRLSPRAIKNIKEWFPNEYKNYILNKEANKYNI